MIRRFRITTHNGNAGLESSDRNGVGRRLALPSVIECQIAEHQIQEGLLGQQQPKPQLTKFRIDPEKRRCRQVGFSIDAKAPMLSGQPEKRATQREINYSERNSLVEVIVKIARKHGAESHLSYAF